MHRIIPILLLLLMACGDSPRTDGAVDVPDTETDIAPESPLDPVDQALKNMLQEETITFSFDATTVSEALDFIRAGKNINVVIDDRIRADLEDLPVTLSVTELDVDSALDLLLRLAGPEYTYVLRDGVVFITDRDGARSDAVLRVHPVGDLTGGRSDFIAPDLILKPAGDGSDEDHPLFGREEEGSDHRKKAQELKDLIIQNIEPDSWEGGDYRISVSGESKLVVVHTPEVQARVARFLDSRR